MFDPKLIEMPEKIGLGVVPSFGTAQAMQDLDALSASWFYNWQPTLPAVDVTKDWFVAPGVTTVYDGANTELSLTGSNAWATQGFVLNTGQSWSLGFDASLLSGIGGGACINYYNDLGQNLGSSTVYLSGVGQHYSLNGQAPTGTTNASLLIWNNPGAAIVADNFTLTGPNISPLLNGNFEAAKETADLSGFVPMIWNAADMPSLGAVARAHPGGALLTFNEPDFSQQANMTVAQALSYWPELMASGMRLGSPAVTTPSTLKAGGWLDNLMKAANANNYRVDFIAVHYYSTNTDVRAFKTFLDQVYAKYGKPVWVTEWSLADFAHPDRFSIEEQKAFFEAGTQMLDDLPYVERQSWFSAYHTNTGLDTAMFDYSDLMTTIGDSFAALAKPVTVIKGGDGDDTLVGSCQRSERKCRGE